MDFTLTEEQVAIRDLATQILTDASTMERLDALDDDGSWLDLSTWSALADAGLLGLAIPAAHGGGDLGLLELHFILRAVGVTAAYVPVWETLVLGALPVAAFGTQAQQTAWLPGVANGEVIMTGALAEDGRTDPMQPLTTAVNDAAVGGWRLTGTKTFVPVATHADMIVVSATTDQGSALFLVDPTAEGVEVTPLEVTTSTPHARVELSGAVGELLGNSAGDGARQLAWLVDRARASLTSMQAGTCETAVTMSARYTSERQQFGRPIATFQAVGQRVADAYMDAQAIDLTSLQAMWLLADEQPADDEIAIAKFWAADGGHRVAHAAQHVHGGVGVDLEYPLHRYFRAAKRVEYVLGHASDQLETLGGRIAANA